MSSTIINSALEEDEFEDYHEERKSSISSSNFNPNFYNPFEVKHRRRTSRGQFKILEKAFSDNPKPNAKTRQELADNLSMTPRGVQVWFQNRRAKAKQQLENKKSHDNVIDDLQVSSPIILSSSGMAHSRSQSSSSSSTSYSFNHVTLSPSALPVPPPQHQQQAQFSDAASTVTEEMIASSPLLLTPPQQKQQDDYCWWIDDVSGIISGHPTLFSAPTDTDPFTTAATEDHPLDAWAYIDSLQISSNNNHNLFLHAHNRDVANWISSTKEACNDDNVLVMLEQQRRQPLIGQDDQVNIKYYIRYLYNYN